MAQTITGSVRTTPTFSYANTVDGMSVAASISTDFTRTLTYGNGTAANQIQQVWTDSITLTTTDTTELDLTALAGGAFGTVTFAKIKELIIQVVTATSGYRLLVGGAASNAFSGWLADASDIVRVDAGGEFRLASPVDGYTVDSTHKVLKLDNPSGGSLTFRILIAGTGTVA